jgi:uncharacterized membrane protein YeaQ/YmgE (transglycosylase-associated protein family)
MVLYILGVLLMGLIVGAIGRLLIPGPNPMSILATIAVGVGGSILGGLVGGLLFGSSGFILAILGAGLIVWVVERARAPAR